MQISNTVSILVVSSPLFLNKLKWFNKQVFFHLQQLNSDSQNYDPLWKTRCRVQTRNSRVQMDGINMFDIAEKNTQNVVF